MPLDPGLRARVGQAARGTPGRALRLAFAVLPLLWLARRVDPGAVLRHAAVIGVIPVALALTLAFANLLIGNLRWRVLMRAYGSDTLPPFRRTLAHVLVAGYFNLLPSGLAGEMVRALRVRPFSPDLGAALTVIAVERVLGLTALLALAAAAALAGPGLAAGPAGLAFRAAAVLAAVLAAAVLVFPWIVRRSPPIHRLVARLPLGEALLLRIAPARRPRGALLALLLSFATQSVALAVAEVLLARLVDAAALAAALRTLPFAILLAYVPITPGAVLQREAVYVVFLGLAGVSADRAVAVAALSFGVQLALSALGGLVYAAEKLGLLAAEPEQP